MTAAGCTIVAVEGQKWGNGIWHHFGWCMFNLSWPWLENLIGPLAGVDTGKVTQIKCNLHTITTLILAHHHHTHHRITNFSVSEP